MTIDRANEYFAALPEGFAPAEELRAALDGLTAHLEFERCDLSRLSRFLPIAPLA